MIEYTANITWRPDAGQADVDLFDLAGDDWGTVVSWEGDGDRLQAVLTTTGASMPDALARAVAHCTDAFPGEVLAAEVVTLEEQDRRLAEPARPELVGLTEVGELLGVTRQRANQLRANPAFPAPTAELRSGPVWVAGDISRFASSWQRKSGRPAASAAG